MENLEISLPVKQANKTVAFYTLGCKLNFSETSTIKRLFTDGGYQKVDFEHGADIVVINTCSVTENADKKCRQLVKQTLKRAPQAYIIIIGCFAQLKPNEIAEIEGVDLVLGASEKFNILKFIEEKSVHAATEIHACEIKDVKTFVPSYSSSDRTRTFLKVQDGCDYFCAFCTIPLARGRSRNPSIASIVDQAKEIALLNVKEVVLTGVNIGDFGKSNGENFLDLIKALEGVEDIERFRISSIEPNLLTNEIIAFVSQSTKFVPHFHIPLQSGSDKILHAMRRRYLTDLYRERVAYIKTLMPNACIGVDVIVGFPSESDADFLDTYNFINSLDVSYLHVFTYSERANTTAVRIQDVVPTKIRAERSKMLHILSDKKKYDFYQQYKNTVHKVLVEKEKEGDFMYGFTENYLKTKIPYNANITNTIQEYKILDFDPKDFIYNIEV